MQNFKILVYGVDKYTEFVISCIKKNNEIVGVTDSFSHFEYFGNIKFILLENIKKIEWDFVIITSRERRVRDEIKKHLIDFGINISKILSFFELFHEEKVVKVMELFPSRTYDGLIIGLSHAAKGLNPRYFDGQWVNMATSGEDLFYHFEVIKKCINEYYKNFRMLKFIVIDMYDYSNFSYDTSLSSQALAYWADGGNCHKHNYKDNKMYSEDIDAEMGRTLGAYPAYYPKRSEIELTYRAIIFDEKRVYKNMDKYFYDLDPAHIAYQDFPNEIQNCGHISEIPMIPITAYIRKNKNMNLYEKTEKENLSIFYSMLGFVRKKLPEVKIVLTLLPRYEKLENLHSDLTYVNLEKNKFEDYLAKTIDNKHVFYINYKKYEPIASNYNLFRDVTHLNYQGSVVMSSILNRKLNEIQEGDKDE